MFTVVNSKNYTFFYSKTWKEISKVKWNLISFLILVLTINFMGLSSFIDQVFNYVVIFFLIVLTAKVKILNIIIALLLATIISLELTYYAIFNERVSTTILSASVDTFISYTIRTSLTVFIKSLPFNVIFSFLFIKSIGEIKKLTNKGYGYFLFMLFIITSFSLFNKFNKEKGSLKGDGISYFNEFPLTFIKQWYYKKYPLVFGDIFYLSADIYTISKMKSNSFHDSWPDGINIVNQNKTPTKIIIILGESSVSTHYSLYGYPYKTTPKLDELYKNNEITAIKDIISPAPFTKESLRLTLSYATPRDDSNFFKYKNIVEMAKLAGYNTLWISTTYENGLYAGYVGAIEKSSDLSYDIYNHELLQSQDDLALPKVLDSLYKVNEKQFIILHMQGSHVPYIDHYDKEDKVLITTKEFEDYDRTIYHTDRVLNKIIKLVKKYNEDSIVYYFSDHGEIVNKGHGLAKDKGGIQYKIPLIIFQNKNDLDIKKIIEKYRGENGLFNNLNSHYVITELLGFSVESELIEQAKQEGEYVFHADGVPHKYEDVQRGDF